MFRRRAAALIGRAWAALPSAAGSGGGAVSSSGAVQQSLAPTAAVAEGTAVRWRHVLARGGRRGHAAQRQLAAANSFRVASWQQIRQQWSDPRGYQHFGGHGQCGFAVVYSQEGRKRALRWVAVLGAGGAVVWVSSRQEVPYTARMHAIIVSPETECDLGRQTFEQVLLEARMSGTLLPQHHRAVQAVRRVGLRIAQAATDGYGGGFQGHLQHMKWEFAVINSPQVNAFVVPGGKVVVYTGLLRLVSNEDELAAVLAHECAHVVARHAAERITQMGALEVVRTVAYWVFGLPLPAGPLTAIFFLPNSRKAETEADVIGIQLMARACFDPSGMVSMFSKMAKVEVREGGDKVPGFLRTHPHSGDRIKAIQKMLPTAEGLYEMNGCNDTLSAIRRVVNRGADCRAGDAMKAAGKSEWATYGALAVAAVLACLLVMAKPLPPSLRTTLHFRLEEPTEPGAGIEVAVTASGAPARVGAATLSAGPQQQATLAQAQQDTQAELADQAQPAEAAEAQPQQTAAASQAAAAEPAEKVPPADPQPATEQQQEQQEAAQQEQAAGGQQATGQQEQKAQQEAPPAAEPQQQEQQPATVPQPAAQQPAAVPQPAAQLPPPPAKRGIDIYREFAANLSSCFASEWAGLDCLRQQQDWTPGPGQYRFPHFGIIGFQKCATTSLFHHLAAHPQVLHSYPKEPEFFTESCNFNALRCPRPAQNRYMHEVLRAGDAQALNFTAASFEGSTHYALEGKWLAPQMRELFPWLRMIVSMREPISQAISMVFHNLDSGRQVGCYERGSGRIYRCGLEYLEDESRYATWLRPWLDNFPREQLYVIQYENLTNAANTMGALRDVKRFLGIAKALPNDELPMANARHQTKQTDGWPMLRWEYVKLMEKARRNALEVVEIVQRHGYADPVGWMANWEAWWKMNLDERCGPRPESECMILLS